MRKYAKVSESMRNKMLRKCECFFKENKLLELSIELRTLKIFLEEY